MTVAETINVWKRFVLRSGLRDWVTRRKMILTALRDVSVKIEDRSIVGVVGESGSGKTTLGRIFVGLERPTAGKVLFGGKELHVNRKSVMSGIQFVFQDPWAAVNPKFTIRQIVEEPLLIQGYGSSERLASVLEALGRVGLPSSQQFLDRYPSELSGGQLQRVVIARAIVSKPRLIVADEPASMLDVSLRIGILNLFLDLRDIYGTSFLFITHDLAQAMYATDYIYVLYLGEVMEEGPTGTVLHSPLNPYTTSLIRSIPTLKSKQIEAIKGEVPSPLNLPMGCGFNTRCPIANAICRQNHPNLEKRDGSRYSRCLLR
jgi:peptide/nickel transport system ATP-binding protein